MISISKFSKIIVHIFLCGGHCHSELVSESVETQCIASLQQVGTEHCSVLTT